MSNINELQEQLKTAREGAIALLEKSETGNLTDEDLVTVKEYQTQIETLEKGIEKSRNDAAAVEFLKGLAPRREEHPAAPEAKSIGEVFTNSEQYKAAVDMLRSGGNVKDIPGVGVGNLFKALVRGNGTPNDPGVGTPLLPVRRLGVVDGSNFKPRVFRDLVDVQESDSPLIEFIRQTFTNNAAFTPEATGVTDDAALKPESAHKWEKAETTAKTVAHLEPVTRRMLNNVPQVRGIIEGDLLEGLEDKLENSILNGAGGSDLTGVAATSGIGSQAYDTDLFTTILKARTKVRIQGRRTPSAIVMAPTDIERVLLARENGATGAFLYGGPATIVQLSIWGIPVVESEVVTPGEAWVADWKTVKLYDVVRASVAWSDSHKDWFQRNIEAVRAEMDVALAVFRPQAIVQASIGTS